MKKRSMNFQRQIIVPPPRSPYQYHNHSRPTNRKPPPLNKKQREFLQNMADWINYTKPIHYYTWFNKATPEVRQWMGLYLGQDVRDWLTRQTFRPTDEKAYEEMKKDMLEFRETKNINLEQGSQDIPEWDNRMGPEKQDNQETLLDKKVPNTKGKKAHGTRTDKSNHNHPHTNIWLLCPWNQRHKYRKRKCAH